jgi:hypothetical protein
MRHDRAAKWVSAPIGPEFSSIVRAQRNEELHMGERARLSLITSLSAALPRRITAGDISAGRESADLRDGRIAAEEARSASNISKWTTYLPLDCVGSMIRMGWDVST